MSERLCRDRRRYPQNRRNDCGYTGQYEVTCQAYNGQFYGWYGQPFLACHGYLDKYISGSHVGHYIPDLFPRGKTLSVECAKALGAGGLTALGT